MVNSHMADLIYRVAVLKQTVNFVGLVWRNRREFVEKFIYADTNTEVVGKCFNTNAGAAENRGPILNFRVNGNG